MVYSSQKSVWCASFVIACSHSHHGQDKTRQSCLVLSCPCRRCEHNCRQDKTVLSCLDPIYNFQVFSNPQYIWDWTVANWKLDRDKNCLVLSAVVFTPPTRTRQDRTVLSFLVRVGSVNKLLRSEDSSWYSLLVQCAGATGVGLDRCQYWVSANTCQYRWASVSANTYFSIGANTSSSFICLNSQHL